MFNGCVCSDDGDAQADDRGKPPKAAESESRAAATADAFSIGHFTSSKA